jgi:hypothetical protein
MPNPASTFCLDHGFKSEIRNAADGSQSGVCIFPDSSECDEWAYYRNECGPMIQVTDTPTIPPQTSTFSSGMVVVQPVSMPAGVIVEPRNGLTGLTGSLSIYASDGLMLGELQAQNASSLHAAGHYKGSLDFPLVFQFTDSESHKPFLGVNYGKTETEPGGQVSILAPLDDKATLAGLVGVPGEPIIFYTIFQPVDSMLRTQFVLGKIDALTTNVPTLTMESNESRSWKPVAIQMKDNAPGGLWFTRFPWGIGGSAPNEGVNYLDLASGTTYEVLPPNALFASLSSDQNWIAYSARIGTRSELFIRNLTGTGSIAMPSLPESEGAGHGFFSPSNHYIVWAESQGSLYDDNLRQTIRAATLDGKIVGNFNDISFYKTADISAGNSVEPIGWLNEEAFLAQVIEVEKPHNGMLIKVDIATGQFTLFAEGYFAGWFYP